MLLVLFGLEIAMLVIGVTTMIRGEISLSKTWHVSDRPARLAGLILALPLPLVFLIGYIIDLIVLSNPDNISLLGLKEPIEWVIVLASIIAGSVILYSAKPPESPVR